MSAYLISQDLFVELPPGSHADFITRMATRQGNDWVFRLASSSERTISEQFADYRMEVCNLASLLEPFGQLRAAQLSIAVRVYEFVPEISVPVELVNILAKLGASIDVDVILMRNQQSKENS